MLTTPRRPHYRKKEEKKMAQETPRSLWPWEKSLRDALGPVDPDAPIISDPDLDEELEDEG